MITIRAAVGVNDHRTAMPRAPRQRRVRAIARARSADQAYQVTQLGVLLLLALAGLLLGDTILRLIAP